jgi:sortase A
MGVAYRRGVSAGPGGRLLAVACAAAVTAGVLGGCTPSDPSRADTRAVGTPAETSASPSRRPAQRPSETGSRRPATSPTTWPTTAPTASPTAPPAPRVEPKRSFLSLPSIGVRDVPVVRYRGRPDDAPGTRIQDRGPAASPRGPRGGVGPGEVGNFIVTAHRTSHAAPFAELPAVGRGDRVLVRSGRRLFVYRITRTRSTSFRSERSLAEQSAPVPGRPGVPARRAMITLSTCATPEDHAAGNYWSDELGNPEHRIDKVGVLVDVPPTED